MQIVILKEVMRLIDCHIFVKNGQWSHASQQMLALSGISPSPLSEVNSFREMVDCLEFAAFATFITKYGVCFMPDYALLYLDSETNFKVYYSENRLEDE